MFFLDTVIFNWRSLKRYTFVVHIYFQLDYAWGKHLFFVNKQRFRHIYVVHFTEIYLCLLPITIC